MGRGGGILSRRPAPTAAAGHGRDLSADELAKFVEELKRKHERKQQGRAAERRVSEDWVRARNLANG
jgi:hypothetical protein